MTELLFGTAGVPRSTPSSSTTNGIERIAALGLGCMEIEFVQGVRMREATARDAAATAARLGIRLSVHGPYYINLNAREEEKIRASQERIYQAARIGALCGAENIVFHAAFYLGDPPDTTYDRVKYFLAEIIERLKREEISVWLRPELTGKGSQFGDLDELLKLSRELEMVAPCIDFSHWHARTNAQNSYADFAATLQKIREELGETGLHNLHVHVSGIEYSAKGERRHLNLKDSDLEYRELLRALRDEDAGGLIVCESPNLEEDALLLQETYRELADTG